MTVIYMDSDMKLIEPRSEAHLQDWDRWCPGALIDEPIDTFRNPKLYEA